MGLRQRLASKATFLMIVLHCFQAEVGRHLLDRGRSGWKIWKGGDPLGMLGILQIVLIASVRMQLG